jgi:hypothetical protein
MLAALRALSPVGRVFPARCDPHTFPSTPVYIYWPYLLPPTALMKLKGRCLNSNRKPATNEAANKLGSVGFDCLTEVVMKSTVFWDISPSSPLKFNQRFGGIFRLHLQDPISRTEYRMKAGGKPAFVTLSYILLGLYFGHDWSSQVTWEI